MICTSRTVAVTSEVVSILGATSHQTTAQAPARNISISNGPCASHFADLASHLSVHTSTLLPLRALSSARSTALLASISSRLKTS
jgi:hypothetical protein